jgi:general secretion pathway protein K
MFIAKPLKHKPAVSTILTNRRGVAILVALGVVAVLFTAGLELNRRIRGSVSSAIRARERLVLSEMAQSGTQVAMVMLINDRKENNTDTLQEDWANPEKVTEMLDLLSYDEGSLSVTISDERGKIQVNALVQFPEGQQFSPTQRLLWERLLEQVFATFEEAPDSDPNMIINSMKDWLDHGDDDAITGLSGAESDYYEQLDPPYSCKNGPFDHLGEIALVQGVTPELFYGAGGVAGLSALLTVHGLSASADNQFTYDGKINISTADALVLSALIPPEQSGLAEALVEYRVAKDDETYINAINNTTWYKNVPGAAGLDINSEMLTVSSDLFRIVSTAKRGQSAYTLTLVVQREKEQESGRWACKTLIWQAE